jgi:hypothetical protein
MQVRVKDVKTACQNRRKTSERRVSTCNEEQPAATRSNAVAHAQTAKTAINQLTQPSQPRAAAERAYIRKHVLIAATHANAAAKAARCRRITHNAVNGLTHACGRVDGPRTQPRHRATQTYTAATADAANETQLSQQTQLIQRTRKHRDPAPLS